MPLRQTPRLLILCAGLITSTAHASLVTNGGFETGDFTGWTKLGPVASYSEVLRNDVTAPHEGNFQASFFSAGGANGVSQLLDTMAGQIYTVSFWFSNPKDCRDQCWFDFTWDGVGQEVASTNARAFGYRQFTYELQASSSSTLLQLYLGNPNTLVFLDDFSVEPVAATATVAEPATMALTLLALLGAGAASRRRRQSSPVFGSRLFQRAAAGALIAAGVTMAGTASADVVKRFTWTIDSRTPTGSSLDSITATDTLTVADTPTTGSFRLITGLKGVQKGEAMTLLSPGVFPPGIATDNNLLDIGASALTYNGLSFAVGGL